MGLYTQDKRKAKKNEEKVLKMYWGCVCVFCAGEIAREDVDFKFFHTQSEGAALVLYKESDNRVKQ